MSLIIGGHSDVMNLAGTIWPRLQPVSHLDLPTPQHPDSKFQQVTGTGENVIGFL